MPDLNVPIHAPAAQGAGLIETGLSRQTVYTGRMLHAVRDAVELPDGTTAVSYTHLGGMVVTDPMGSWLKCFATLAMMATLVYGRAYAASRDMMRGGELFTLSLFSLLGIYVMISGHNFLVIYLGLEMLTLSSYALVALRRDDGRATEAAMKYFVLGALASGFLLYGCLLYTSRCV